MSYTHFERLSGLDAADPIRHLVEVQLHKTPRFRQKLAFTPLTEAPVWIDDPSFHLD